MVDFQSRDTSRQLDEDGEEASTSADDDGENEPPDGEGGSGEDGTDGSVDQRDDGIGTAVAESADAVSVAILVVEAGADDAADAVAEAVDDGHDVLGRDARTGELDAVQSAVDTFIDQPSVDVVLTVGGVDVGPDQVTVDAVEPLLDTNLPGFGELCRREVERRVGSTAFRTRTFAGIASETPVFCLPADPAIAGEATEDLVVPELADLVAAADED